MKCYLIGYPVAHSMSPYMHNAGFDKLDLDLSYKIVPIKPEELERFVEEEMRADVFRGGNVTIPHKVSVTGYLDELDETAYIIGAVNTIVKEGENLKGYNTDGYGALRALRESYGDLEGVIAVMIGAGGAARAIGYSLSTLARSIKMYNRTLRHAEELVRQLSATDEGISTVSAHPLSDLKKAESLADVDILINATPVGMPPYQEETPIDADLLHPDLLVFDIVYNPVKTRLLKDAVNCGAQVIPGYRMLVYQGVRAFELWTGVKAPEGLMMRVVEEKLGLH
ncbi:MAG: shikimate dehydrogenase [Candidatus Bathyarchaeia archaeon]